MLNFGPTQQKIIDFLKQEPVGFFNTKWISNGTGLTSDATRKACERLVKTGFLLKSDSLKSYAIVRSRLGLNEPGLREPTPPLKALWFRRTKDGGVSLMEKR